MSKGKDFRAPRKRGFDDDGPMPYEPKTRTPRAFGGAPTAVSAASRRWAWRPPRRSAGPTVDAVVKWFKADKGYGFVELAGGQGDAFLHANALHASGHESGARGREAQGDRRRRRQGRAGDAGGRGRHRPASSSGRSARSATPRARRAAPRRVAPDPSSAVAVSGKVKWFDDAKGFGFVASDDGGKDVFVHISVLGPAGISHLAEGQQVNMRVVDTPKGREAISLSL